MPEGMNVEIAHQLSEREEREQREKRWWHELVEIIEVIILAIVAVATAWSGYQAAKFDGSQAFLYATASRIRFEADASSTLGGQSLLFDATTFNSWLEAHLKGEHKLEALYERRFSPEYHVAFESWLALHPFSSPHAPPGPAYMPDYHNPQSEQADSLNSEASATFEEGTSARESADRYVRQTVLFATVLFLVAIAQRFRFRGVRIAASLIAGALMVVALAGLVTLPRL